MNVLVLYVVLNWKAGGGVLREDKESTVITATLLYSSVAEKIRQKVH